MKIDYRILTLLLVSVATAAVLGTGKIAVYVDPSDLSETTTREFVIPLTRIRIWVTEVTTSKSRIFERLVELDPDFKTDEVFKKVLISEMSWRWKDGGCAFFTLVSRKDEEWRIWISDNPGAAVAIWFNAIRKLRDQPSQQVLENVTNDLIESRF